VCAASRDRNGTVRRILIIKPSSAGDIVHALPVLHGLRVRWPSARIAWLVAVPFADLLRGHPELDELILFDRHRFGRIGRSVPVSVEFVRFLQALRARRFEMVIDLQGLFRSAFLAMATGAGTRIGFADARELGWVFYTHRIAPPQEEIHAAERNYRLSRLLGFGHVPMQFVLPVDPAVRSSAQRLMEQAGVPAGRAYAVLAPAARWETKLWAPERFAAVARHLHQRYGLVVMLVGAGRDRPIADAIGAMTGPATVNLAGRTTLAEMVALLENASVVITNDSGPMHMAAALGRPLVAVYGPTSPIRTGPYNRPGSVVRAGLPCSPCYIRKLSRCPHGHACMSRITVEDVLTVVASELAGAGKRTARSTLCASS